MTPHTMRDCDYYYDHFDELTDFQKEQFRILSETMETFAWWHEPLEMVHYNNEIRWRMRLKIRFRATWQSPRQYRRQRALSYGGKK